MKRRLVIPGILLFCVIFCLAAVAWFFPEQILTVESGPVKGDALVVLGGAGADRTRRAAELFKEGEAPKILVSGWGDCQWNKIQLEADGVPAADIMLECKSRTTRQNAEFSIPLLRAIGARRVIVVTSWYHSRRALRCFKHYAPDLQIYSRPSYFGYVGKSAGEIPSSEQARKAEWKAVRNYADSEYFKLVGYWLFYGVCPF